jgi:hypothetical protein
MIKTKKVKRLRNPKNPCHKHHFPRPLKMKKLPRLKNKKSIPTINIKKT